MVDNVLATDVVERFDVGASAPTDAVLHAIDLARTVVDLEATVEQKEAELKALTKELHMLKTVKLPDAMTAAGLAEFKLPSGVKVSIGDFVSGSLPKDPKHRQQAIHWLESVGAGDLVKTSIALQFGKKEHNYAMTLAARLRDQGFDPKVENGVHSSTLQAFARERMRRGEEVPFETLGLYAGRIAKITAGRE